MARVRDMQGVPAHLETLKSDGHGRHPSHCLFHDGKGDARICTNPQNITMYFSHCKSSNKEVMESFGVDYLKKTDPVRYETEIKKYEPGYSAPVQTQQSQNKSGGGCYVATAIYGSYDCPEVWTLRRYRDYTLAETWYGRAFIRTYYAISPTLVKWFGDTKWFKDLWKSRLDRMVAKLRNQGVEDTPYDDRVW